MDPVKARLGEPDESLEQRAERELARLAILQPAVFAAEMDKHKKPQDRLNEQIALFSISQPKAYAAEFEKFKEPERRQQEQQARAAVLDPVTHSGRLEDFLKEVRRKHARGEEVDEILKLRPRKRAGQPTGQPSPPAGQ